MSTLLKYLSEWAEPEVRSFSPKGLDHTYQEIVVIPSYGECEILEDCLLHLKSAAAFSNRKTLVLVLINGKNDTSEYGLANQRLLTKASAFPKGTFNDSYFEKKELLDIFYLDRTSEQITGVGHARKLGCDYALKITTELNLPIAFFHTTDADALVDKTYFDFSQLKEVGGLGKKTGAVVHPFTHEGADISASPMALYDGWLKYYENGLRSAGSPYAFQTIGSLLSMAPSTYAEVRGFPKKDAAEDFYFLCKAAKVSKVAVGGGEVRLKLRASQRVPFGTGVGVAKIEKLLNENQAYHYYHPEVFDWLKQVLAKAIKNLDTPSEQPYPEFVKQALSKTGYFQAIKLAAERKTPTDKTRTFHSHWDGFKTLRFIHILSETLQPVPWNSVT